MRNKFTIEEVREFWDRVSDKYDVSHTNIIDTHHRRFVEAIKYSDLKHRDKVLNIWARTGEATPYLRDQCQTIDLFNLEVSPNFILLAKERFPNENFQETDLSSLDFQDEFFDTVLSLETLEHTPDPERFLSEIYRVSKKDGILIMSVPPATAEIPQKIYNILANNHGEGPHKFLPSRIVKHMLQKVGFKLLEHKGTSLIPVGPNFLKRIGEITIQFCQNTFVKEFGILQLYVVKK